MIWGALRRVARTESPSSVDTVHTTGQSNIPYQIYINGRILCSIGRANFADGDQNHDGLILHVRTGDSGHTLTHHLKTTYDVDLSKEFRRLGGQLAPVVSIRGCFECER